MSNRPVLRMMTPGCMGTVFLRWQRAPGLTAFQRTHFLSLPSAGRGDGVGGGNSVRFKSSLFWATYKEA